MNPNESRTRACKLAESLGWFLGQGKDRKPVLHRPGHAPEQFATWLIALTELMRLRELLPRGEARQPAPSIPVAVHAPPRAQPAQYQRTTLATDALPMAEVVEVDRHGQIIPRGAETVRRSSRIGQ